MENNDTTQTEAATYQRFLHTPVTWLPPLSVSDVVVIMTSLRCSIARAWKRANDDLANDYVSAYWRDEARANFAVYSKFGGSSSFDEVVEGMDTLS